MNIIIYLIAFLEGFTTLSVEIVALRRFTPIIGTNSISTSIILGVILLALSYGYYIGGKKTSTSKNIKKILVNNLIFASIYYFFISFTFDSLLLEKLLFLTDSYFLSILISSVILFFIPVFLASQTIPLLSELLKGGKAGEKMGKLLFHSTIGSFIGSVGTSSLFFPILGVYKTGILSSMFLIICSIIILFLFKDNMVKKIISFSILTLLLSILFLPYKNNGIIYEKSNAYHNIKILDYGEKRLFLLDDGFSSGIDKKTKKSFFGYIKEVEKQVLEEKPKKVLVIGAAGFTFPNDISEYDFVDTIDVVDIDASLKEITEKYFLEKKLSDKINFYDIPSRYFLNNLGNKKYDLVLVDAYTGKSLAPQVLTYEFFTKLQSVSDSIYLNLILDTKLESDFSKRLFSTINKAFGDFYYKDVNVNAGYKTNIIVSNKNHNGYIKKSIDNEYYYTDNKNSIELDIFKLK